MTKKKLSNQLKFLWWMHTLITSLFFVLLTFFILFVFEDFFNEKQLEDLSQIVALNESTEGLPPHIQIYSLSEIPTSWHKLLNALPLNKAIEADNKNNEQIHIIKAQFNASNDFFVLTFDTSKTLSVWRASGKLLTLILPWILVFLLLASFLANKFTKKIQIHFNDLAESLEHAKSPDILEKFSDKQPIEELAKFAQLFAKEWKQKIHIINREKQGLEYLSHELRTPIQSSLATLELLALKTKDKKAIERLTRSLNRMTRLSNCILNLMESKISNRLEEIDVLKICQQLVCELEPLARIKKQPIILEENSTTIIRATQEAIEIIVSILLTNALQHCSDEHCSEEKNNKMPITITLNKNKITVKNKIRNELLSQQVDTDKIDTQGFGIGLSIAKRLSDKFELNLSVVKQNNNYVVATLSNQ